MSWYYEINNEQKGPVSEEELRGIIQEGGIPAGSRVWTQGMEDWEAFESVFPLEGEKCPTCGALAPRSTWIPVGDTFVCPACKDSYAQRLREGVSTDMAVKNRGTGGSLNAADYRAKARETLNGNWPIAVGAMFVYMLIVIGLSLIPILGALIQYVVTGPLIVGMSLLFLNIVREERAEFGDMFKGFSQMLPAIGVYFLTLIIAGFVTLAAAIPGIIFAIVVAMPSIQSGSDPFTESNPLFIVAIFVAAIPAIIAQTYMYLRFALVYTLLADPEEEHGVTEILTRSGELMRGRKLKLLWLGLSFVGWYLLGVITIIGWLWVAAYFSAAFIAFYDDIHEPAES